MVSIKKYSFVNPTCRADVPLDITQDTAMIIMIQITIQISSRSEGFKFDLVLVHLNGQETARVVKEFGIPSTVFRLRIFIVL